MLGQEFLISKPYFKLPDQNTDSLRSLNTDYRIQITENRFFIIAASSHPNIGQCVVNTEVVVSEEYNLETGTCNVQKHVYKDHFEKS